MVNKRGMLRIVEASIAVVIVLGVILIISRNQNTRTERDISEFIPGFLNEMALNTAWRDKVFNDETGAVSDFESYLNNKIENQKIGYKGVICKNIYETCGGLANYPDDAEGGIFSGERVISASLGAGNYSPKKVKLYLWVKK